MKISLDCEFTKLSSNGDLISIGMIDENGVKFYAELLDFRYLDIIDNSWMMKNVIEKLKYINISMVKTYWEEVFENDELLKTEYLFPSDNGLEMFGNRFTVKNHMEKWLSQYDNVEIIADCGHYDFMYFIDLLCGNALNLPHNICPAYIELNNIIADKFNINQQEAFNMDRINIIAKSYMETYSNNQHNSLSDAINQMKVYKILTNRLYF